MRTILVLLVILTAASLPVRVAARALEPQATADLIKLRSTSHANFPVGEISESGHIAAIIAFINHLPARWNVPWYGPPVGQVYLSFYRDKKFVGNFYAGPNFFGRDLGNFWSQSASPQQLAELGDLLGFDLKPYLSPSSKQKAGQASSDTVR
jgi:hypothetical protein